MVSYHRPNDLRRSVSSILSNTSRPFHLHIIDNSSGFNDHVFHEFTDERITIYHNTQNIGKGAAIMRWYKQITADNSNDHIVSIDSDIEVPPLWLENLLTAAYRIRQCGMFGIMAPVILQKTGDAYAGIGHHMHITGADTKMWLPNIYYNRRTAGPLFLIDKPFFDRVGYVQDQLYGNDDGCLCAAAARERRFIGVTSNVAVVHLNSDSDQEYINWKARNVNRVVDSKGRWD